MRRQEMRILRVKRDDEMIVGRFSIGGVFLQKFHYVT